jgi:HAD superfamily phosphoserine phosphatase-like hydrolase
LTRAAVRDTLAAGHFIKEEYMKTTEQDVLFLDIDDTLYRGSLAHDTMEWFAGRRLLHEGFVDNMFGMKRRWEAGEVTFDDYSGVIIRFLDDGGMSGLDESHFLEAAKSVVAEKGKRVNVFTRELVRAAQSAGYATAAISHSPELIVAEMAKLWGLSHSHGTQYLVNEERVLTGGRIKHKKGPVVEELFAKHMWSRKQTVAIGDSGSDMPMLEAAQFPIAFNPTRELERYARVRGIPVVKECNDTIEIWRQDPGQTYFREIPIGDILPGPIANNFDLNLFRLGYDTL